MALAAQAHGVRLGIKSLPSGSLAVELCQRMAASPGDCLQLSLTTLNAECAAALASFKGMQLSLPALVSLSAECATALSAFPGKLSLGVKTWTDKALIALARQSRELEINPPAISSEVAAALGARGPLHDIDIFRIHALVAERCSRGQSAGLRRQTGVPARPLDVSRVREAIGGKRRVGAQQIASHAVASQTLRFSRHLEARHVVPSCPFRQDRPRE